MAITVGCLFFGLFWGPDLTSPWRPAEVLTLEPLERCGRWRKIDVAIDRGRTLPRRTNQMVNILRLWLRHHVIN